MSTATIDDPQLAWVTASPAEELARWRAMYDALHPAPAKPDCSHLHSAFGPGCPYCSPQDRAASRTRVTAAARCAPNAQEGTS